MISTTSAHSSVAVLSDLSIASAGAARRRLGIALCLAASFVMVGCGASGAGSAPSEASAFAPAGLTSGCDWHETQSDFAYPETDARYFRATLPTPRVGGMRIRIEGQYLPTRYFSLQLYGATFNVIDARADYQLAPDAGSRSPVSGVTSLDPLVAPGGHYTAYVEFSDRPTEPAPNTLYAGRSFDATKPLYLSLRAYLATGVLDLPRLTIESTRGEQALGTASTSAGCAIAEAISVPIVDLEALDTQLPALPPLFAGRHSVAFSVYRGVAGGIGGEGIAYNQNADYMAATVARSTDLLLVRARAPTFPAPRGASVPDVRYWSFCQNRKALQSVVDCNADLDTAVDRDGIFYEVLGVDDRPPPGIDATHGYTYLRFGDADPGYLIYRQILPLPDFIGAISRVPEGADPYAVLGNYAPVGVHCAPALVAARIAAGDSPAQVFSACLTAP